MTKIKLKDLQNLDLNKIKLNDALEITYMLSKYYHDNLASINEKNIINKAIDIIKKEYNKKSKE